MVMLNDGMVVEVLSTGKKPESIALAPLTLQGVANVDWVSVWFLDMNKNEIVSPTEAFTLVGSNAKLLFAPTETLICAAEASKGRAARAAATEKRILDRRRDEE